MGITDELRKWGYGFCGDTHDVVTAIADRIDAATVELPKDADGEYIHIGDVMEWCDSGETLTVEGIGRDVLFYIDGENAEWAAARNKRHHHEPTVEDVLREFAEKITDSQIPGVHPTYEESIAEYSAKLRLANDGEEQYANGNLQVRVPKAPGDAHN